MPSIPVVNPLGYVGVFLVIAGLFLAIAGLGLIKIEKLTITPGRKTWGIGLLLAAIGVLFLLPEINSAINPSAVPNAIATAAPNTTIPMPTLTSIIATIVQPTSVNNISAVETSTSVLLTLETPTAASLSIACVTSQSGTGLPAEVQADSLTFEGGPNLPLANGEEILFSNMRSFEVIQVSTDYSAHVRVTITLLNGDIITEDAFDPVGNLRGTANYGSFSINLTEVKRVEFRQQGEC